MDSLPGSRHRNRAILRYLPGLLLLAAAAVFFAFHFLHLTADFPNNSPWMDWAKYTDEGWYGDAAIRHFIRHFGTGRATSTSHTSRLARP